MAVIGYAFAAEAVEMHKQGYRLQDEGADTDACDYGDDGDMLRPNLDAALAKLGPGDTLLVTRLDRLGPSTDAVQGIIMAVCQKEASIRAVLDEITVTPEDLQRANRLVLALEAIGEAHAQRTAAQDATKAKRRRSNAGRPKSLTPDQIRHARQSIDNGQENVSSMARIMKVNKTTLWRALKPA